MKLVFLGENDWANTCNRIARAINRCGGEMTARVVTAKVHKFGYPEDVVIARDGDEPARAALAGADWIISSGDGKYEVFRELMARLADGRGRPRLATRHAGTAFRTNPDHFNRLDREWGFERRFMACDLYRFVTDDPSARVFVQPQEDIAAGLPGLVGPVRICHAPSRRAAKGTDGILATLREGLPGAPYTEFDLIEGVGFSECNARMRRCHVLVDQIEPSIGGFGAAAMEGLAAGLAVYGHIGNVSPLVERWLPLPPIIHVESPQQLVEGLRGMIQDHEALAAVRANGLAWAAQYLSPEFTYRYWWQSLGESQPSRPHRPAVAVSPGAAEQPEDRPFRATAVLHVRNEQEILRRCFDHLLSNGLDIAVIDNDSDDRTPEIIASYGAHEVPVREHVPFNGVLDLPALLQKLAEVVDTLASDWIVYQGTDEILTTPSGEETLLAGFERVDRLGYSAINFHEYVFVPTSRWFGHEGKDYVRRMRHYYFFQPYYPRLVRAWKNLPGVSNFASAGHIVAGGGLALSPEDWTLRHYIARSLRQARQKYAQRRYSSQALGLGWHGNRLGINWQRIVLPRRRNLKFLPPGSNEFDRSDPWTAHFWQRQ
jgi:hypothetical protein